MNRWSISSEALKSELLEIQVVAHPFRAVVFPLAAAVELAHHVLTRVVPEVPERFARVCEF
jgi:hypothetical protein